MNRVGVVAVAGLGGLAMWVGWAASRSPAPSPTPPPCHFEVGESLSFEVKLAGTVSVDPSALLGRTTAGRAEAPSTHTSRLQGLLRWQVLDSGPAGARMAGVLDEKTRGRLNFGLEIEPGCRFARLGVPSEFDPGVVDQLRALLALANVRLEPQARWQDEAIDGLGRAEVQYLRRADGSVSRRKMHYIALHGDQRLHASVEQSATELVPDPAGRWLRSLVSHEVIVVGLDGREVTRSDVRLSLHRVQDPSAEPLPMLGALSWLSADTPLPRPPAPAKASPQVTLLSPDELLEGLALYAGSKDRVGALELMMAQLLAQPGLRQELGDRLIQGNLPVQATEVFVLALRELGDEAQLVRLARADLPEADLSRTWHALSKLKTPGPQALQVLLERSEAPGRQGDMARLSLGTLTSRVEGELRTRAVQGLADGLASAPVDSESLAAALAAVGNSGAHELFDAVEPWLHDEAQGTRSQAAQALRNMPCPEADAALMQVLTEDAQAGVRRRAGQTLSARAQKGLGGLDTQALGAVASRLALEPDPDTRRALIELLGRSADPAAQTQLAAWFRLEPDDDNRRSIGRFVSARALASAR